MAQPPESRVEIKTFNGLVSNRGPLAGQPGDALVQKNLLSPSPGKLQTRKGRRALAFDAATGASGNILAMHFDKGVDTGLLFLHTASGQIVLAINPS